MGGGPDSGNLSLRVVGRSMKPEAAVAVFPPSIVTVTMNPALDISTDTDIVRATEKIRCGAVRYDPGGGGVNVARVAQELGARVCAVLPVGGSTGATVAGLLEEAHVPFQAVRIGGTTRESFTVNERSSGRQFRFVLPGPLLTLTEQQACLDRIRTASAGARFVVASGSLPPGVAPDFYQRVADIAHASNARLILDASGCGLAGISSGAFMVKPSLRELAELTGRPLETQADQIEAARGLIDRGITETVVVSCGSRGALLVAAGGGRHVAPIAVAGGSGVGAGDAMVAAIAVALCRAWTLDDAVRYGVAAGAAMLMTPGTATCRGADVEQFFGGSSDCADPAEPPGAHAAPG